MSARKLETRPMRVCIAPDGTVCIAPKERCDYIRSDIAEKMAEALRFALTLGDGFEHREFRAQIEEARIALAAYESTKEK